MIELPEFYVLATQINSVASGKVIRRVIANAYTHAFASFSGDPQNYEAMLTGKSIAKSSLGAGSVGGSHLEILCGDMALIISTPVRYHPPGENAATKHQLLLEFTDSSSLSFIVQMMGALLCIQAADITNPDGPCRQIPSPLDEAFNIEYFFDLLRDAKPTLSAKSFLTSDDRIPGLGNGVMHDILFNARIHPKRRIESFTQNNKERLFSSVKTTLRYMAERGGRDTERDLFGNMGGYKTILSSKSSGIPCRNCGRLILKEMYLGGNIYYCPECQPLFE